MRSHSQSCTAITSYWEAVTDKFLPVLTSRAWRGAPLLLRSLLMMTTMIWTGWDEELAGEPVCPLLWAWPLPVHLALNKLRMWDSCEQPGTFQAIVLQADRAWEQVSLVCTLGHSDPLFWPDRHAQSVRQAAGADQSHCMFVLLSYFCEPLIH